MNEKKIKSGRRGFLIGAGSAGMAGAAVVATGGAFNEKSDEKLAAKPQTNGRGGGYHVTEHVRRYYRSTLV